MPINKTYRTWIRRICHGWLQVIFRYRIPYQGCVSGKAAGSSFPQKIQPGLGQCHSHVLAYRKGGRL